jgi:membrane-associated phospholipid phosphatase
MQEFAKWSTFYSVAGSAAATLIGLQFVVITLLADDPPPDVANTGSAFASPTIFHFGAVLLLALLMHMPWSTVTPAAALWAILGCVGMAYSAVVLRRMRKLTAYKPVLEDWIYYGGLPLVAYAVLAASSLFGTSSTHTALIAVGAAVLLLLFNAIHNAWDNVAYYVFVSKAKRSADRHSGEIT